MSQHPIAPPTVLSLHGVDEATGRPVTWHVTTLTEAGDPSTYLVERVDGEVHNPAVWMQAQREAQVVGEEDVVRLVRQVLFAPEGRSA